MIHYTRKCSRFLEFKQHEVGSFTPENSDKLWGKKELLQGGAPQVIFVGLYYNPMKTKDISTISPTY